MNREILSRGKRTDNGEWVEGFYWKDIWGDNTEYIYYDGESYKVIPDTVGRYTGLTDKNGKKIFEGDILKSADGDGEKSLHTVQWSDDYSGWATQGIDMKYFAETIYFWDDYRECYEVIGNIHDNLELLEG